MSKATVAEIVDALARIDPDLSQYDWFRIAAGLFNEMGDAGFPFFDEWSSQSATKYPGRNRCWAQWVYSRRYGREGETRPITIGTVFWLAKQHNLPRTKLAPPPQRSGVCQRCGAVGLVELHHWAPVAVFADFDLWPTNELCQKCHALWHEKMLRYAEVSHA
jgi:hypothetical protein